MKIEKFEDINSWQEAKILVNMVYEITKSSKPLWSDFRFKAQFTDASVSIMSNIAEGFSRKSDKEFVQFLFIAKGSAAEVQSLLYVALDQEYISKDKFEELYNQSDKVSRLISKFITYLRNS